MDISNKRHFSVIVKPQGSPRVVGVPSKKENPYSIVKEQMEYFPLIVRMTKGQDFYPRSMVWGRTIRDCYEKIYNYLKL
jgi:hypothetical protein